MAITARFYPSAVAAMFNSDINSGDTFKMALLGAGGTFTSTDTVYSDVSGDEISASGNYSTGGATISPTISATSDSTKTSFTVGSASWTTATITFKHAVIYSSTSNALLMHLEWDSLQEAVAQDFTVNAPSPAPSATPSV